MATVASLLMAFGLAIVPYNFGSHRWSSEWTRTIRGVSLMMFVVFMPWYVVSVGLGADGWLVPVAMVMFCAAYGMGLGHRTRSRRYNRQSSGAIVADLKYRLLEIDLNAAGSLLTWDQATYMPNGGAISRGRQSAMLRRLAHERFVDPALGRLMDRLEPCADKLPADDASLIRVVRRDYERAIRVPAEYVARANAHFSASYNAWTRARPANDFAAMIPFLERTLDLSREYASFFAPYHHIADPMIDEADEGLTTATVQRLFAELRRELIPMVRAICDQPPADDGCLHRSFGEAAQLGFGLSVAAQMGYDLERGRLDKTHHPFCTKFAAGDVRITTRVRENDIRDALFSTLHEAGHAIYEQGVNAAYEGTPLGSGVSAGVHESQSRLWENVVARSRPFWEHYYPALQRTFPISSDRYRLISFIAPSTRWNARSSAPTLTK